MYYIGISAYYHESSVFLTNNKDVNCFLKEDSFSRIKGDKNFTKRSLNFLIEKFNLKNENIQFININYVYKEMPMLYPPENKYLMEMKLVNLLISIS